MSSKYTAGLFWPCIGGLNKTELENTGGASLHDRMTKVSELWLDKHYVVSNSSAVGIDLLRKDTPSDTVQNKGSGINNDALHSK